MLHEQIAEDVYRIEVPLPDTPLRITNSYLLKGNDRDLLIDTGFNHPQCLDAMREALRGLRADPARTDLFITHMHGDHCGLVRHLAGPGARIFMSEADKPFVADARTHDHWQRLAEFFHFSGLTAHGFDNDVACHPGFSLAPPPGADITAVPDNHIIELGRRRLRCVLTPGHTAGHMCLYDEERGMLFSGDHILGRITPNITAVGIEKDVLAEYLRSLDKVGEMEVGIVFPGHRQVVPDCRARVGELKEHHNRRLAEVLRIVGDRRVTVVDVTREMRWSLTYRNWLDYPPAQKLFSAGEGFAHLLHLVNLGELRMTREDGKLFFNS